MKKYALFLLVNSVVIATNNQPNNFTSQIRRWKKSKRENVIQFLEVKNGYKVNEKIDNKKGKNVEIVPNKKN